MYVVYLCGEIYGVTKSREEAFKVINSFITYHFSDKDFYKERKESLESSYERDRDFTDSENCWAVYTDNIF